MRRSFHWMSTGTAPGGQLGRAGPARQDRHVKFVGIVRPLRGASLLGLGRQPLLLAPGGQLLQVLGVPGPQFLGLSIEVFGRGRGGWPGQQASSQEGRQHPRDRSWHTEMDVVIHLLLVYHAVRPGGNSPCRRRAAGFIPAVGRRFSAASGNRGDKPRGSLPGPFPLRPALPCRRRRRRRRGWSRSPACGRTPGPPWRRARGPCRCPPIRRRAGRCSRPRSGRG